MDEYTKWAQAKGGLVYHPARPQARQDLDRLLRKAVFDAGMTLSHFEGHWEKVREAVFEEPTTSLGDVE